MQLNLLLIGKVVGEVLRHPRVRIPEIPEQECDSYALPRVPCSRDDEAA